MANNQPLKCSRLLLLIINARFGTHPARVPFFSRLNKRRMTKKKKAICRLAGGLTVIWFIPHVECKLTSPLAQRHAWTSHYKQDLFPLSSSSLCIVAIKRNKGGGRRRFLRMLHVRLPPCSAACSLASQIYITLLGKKRGRGWGVRFLSGRN